ncbi:hypothetical protein QQS21_001611 [Conoideocrella luteorostrata]|uniref:Amidohydrolase 3 domain-containing protein n=1 Tax=Conoideocrella luteorostrata TaxID=1105319 RepID=A0AAJ0CWM3_9HYPO|nr:hypothetical protein QQS21_001611 [Conoideocrella luteorostrata]
MVLAPFLRWGSFLSIVVAVSIAFALSAQQEPLSFFTSNSPNSSKNAATYCYKGVRTHDHDNPSAQCFSVVDGTFSRVWGDAALDHSASPPCDQEKVLDGYVIPGLWDGHAHLMAWGEFLHSVDLFGAENLTEARSRIKSYLTKNPEAGKKDFWLRGTGWDQDKYGRMPTAKDLEEEPALKGLYIMLDRIDGHCIWVSRPVLDLLPKNLTDIPGGEIIRDPGPGVFCDNAMDPVYNFWPGTNEETKTRLVKDAMKDLNKVGLVGVHDAGTPPGLIKLYNKLADNGDDWTVRVYSMIDCDERNTFCKDNATRIARNDSRLWVQSVKLFVDGALGSWGSAMLEPYSDLKNKTGSLIVNSTVMTNLTKSWAEAGFQVNVHAIGDRANRETIDAFVAGLIHVCPEATPDNYEALRICQVKHRFRIEHAQIVHPDDQARMAKIGIIPSVQPTHPTDDMRYALDRLGPERTETEAYRMRSYINIAPLLGSDFPVEPPNPFHGIYAAVTRKNPGTGKGFNGSSEGWHKEEALTFDEAMWGFTGATAYGAFLDGRAGLIKEKAFADWVVLDKPIEHMDIEDLRTLEVKETWVAGKKVYSRDK